MGLCPSFSRALGRILPIPTVFLAAAKQLLPELDSGFDDLKGFKGSLLPFSVLCKPPPSSRSLSLEPAWGNSHLRARHPSVAPVLSSVPSRDAPQVFPTFATEIFQQVSLRTQRPRALLLPQRSPSQLLPRGTGPHCSRWEILRAAEPL